jgi:hypothetical protein
VHHPTGHSRAMTAHGPIVEPRVAGTPVITRSICSRAHVDRQEDYG